MQGFVNRIGAGCLLLVLAAGALEAQSMKVVGSAPLKIDYPLPKSLFPPDIAAPTFLWRDPAAGISKWRIEVAFFDKTNPIRVTSPGELMKIGQIDERCIAETNELPKLSPEQAVTHTWKPAPEVWAEIKKRSTGSFATVTISGYREAGAAQPVSRGQVTIGTSKDPVGAPIFFRDVPLMPAQLEKGVIKPLPKSALPLVAWRLRYVGEPSSRLMVDNLPTCMNCHSFSKDGKTLGLDLDGPQNDKGLYALVPISKQMSIRNEDVIAWSSFKGKLGAKIRVGFMSQVSPDAQYVVTMVNGADVSRPPAGTPLPKDVQGNFYVSNFKDYRFLQVFYPTRGILAWYSRATGKLQPLPGADDPRYVHTNAVWSPDGKYLVFARAEARDPYAPGGKLAEKSNDPNETPIQYDLYRIPFNGGKGGTPEPIAGASRNGKSNSFPKISPDGRWIVYVQARNGLLMRPDSQLHIVPASGGEARRLSSNTPLMNSWHSFSPNGRWLVFSSKSRSPYTQMFLTHLDENGNDTPPILIENATAANRAVNLPEFVNIGENEWLKIDAPATEFYRLSDGALESMQRGQYDAAVAEWKKALAMEPSDTTALNNFGATLTAMGQFDEAAAQFKKVMEIDPDNYKAYSNLGVAMARAGRFDEAGVQLKKAMDLKPDDAKTLSAYGGLLVNTGRLDDARPHLEKALEIDPTDADAHNNLGSILARSGKFDEAVPHFEKALAAEPNSFALHFNLGRALALTGKANEGIGHVEKAVELSGGRELVILDRLATMYAEAGRFPDAIATARRALDVVPGAEEREALKARIAAYESKASGSR
jgi:Flp pilus assembly protein TadD